MPKKDIYAKSSTFSCCFKTKGDFPSSYGIHHPLLQPFSFILLLLFKEKAFYMSIFSHLSKYEIAGEHFLGYIPCRKRVLLENVLS